jgi:hypothetical protein
LVAAIRRIFKDKGVIDRLSIAINRHQFAKK